MTVRRFCSAVATSVRTSNSQNTYVTEKILYSPWGGGVLPYKGLMGTCGQPVYVFRDFCLKQGIDFIIFCLNQGIDFINF